MYRTAQIFMTDWKYYEVCNNVRILNEDKARRSSYIDTHLNK